MRSRLASPVAPAVTVRPRTRAALIVATSGAVLLGAAVPAAIALPSGSRSSTHVRGTVERIHLDDFGQPGMAGNDQLTFVRNGDGMVQVPAADLGSVPTGATVDVALASDDGLAHTAAGSYTTTFGGAAAHDPHAGVDVAAVQVAPVAPGAVATGSGLAAANYAVAAGIAPHSVEVGMVQLPGTTGPSISGASVVATVNGAVNSYWNTVTRGAATFTSTAYSTVVTTTHVPCSTIGGSTSINGTDAFWSEVETKVGFTAGSGRHLLVYFDHTTACGGIAGLASLGSTIASGGDVWINGYNELDVIGHELGHNLSLGHSELLDCATAGVRVTDTTDPATCGPRGYADTNDIMGQQRLSQRLAPAPPRAADRDRPESPVGRWCGHRDPDSARDTRKPARPYSHVGWDALRRGVPPTGGPGHVAVVLPVMGLVGCDRAQGVRPVQRRDEGRVRPLPFVSARRQPDHAGHRMGVTQGDACYRGLGRARRWSARRESGHDHADDRSGGLPDRSVVR